MPEAPTGIHDVASVRVQAAMGVGQPWGQAAIGSSMGAWAGLLRLPDISHALKRSGALGQRDGPDTNGIFPGHLSLSYPLSHSPLPVLLSPEASGLHKVRLFHRNRSGV